MKEGLLFSSLCFNLNMMKRDIKNNPTYNLTDNYNALVKGF